MDTNSKQYKAVIQQMSKDGCNGSMFTSVQSIKNLMKNYNSRGEWVEPTTGLTGLLVTDETGDSYKKIIDIPESSKDKMFEAVPSDALDSVTRESVESQLVKSGNTFVKKPSSGSTLDMRI